MDGENSELNGISIDGIGGDFALLLEKGSPVNFAGVKYKLTELAPGIFDVQIRDHKDYKFWISFNLRIKQLMGPTNEKSKES